MGNGAETFHMSFWRRALGVPELETRAESTGPTIPVRSSGSRSVSLESSLGLSGIYRALAIISTSVGQLELHAYKRGRQLAADPLLVQKPDVDRSRRSFLKRTTVSLGGTGESFWRVFRDPSGKPSGVRVLDPLRVGIGRDRNGRRYFEYREVWEQTPRRFRPVTDGGRSGEIMHLRLMEVPGLDRGLGPIQSCRASIAGGIDLRDYSEEWFHRSDIPSGVLSTTQQLNGDDAARYRDRWNESFTDHGVAVLGAGLSYSPVLLKPSDAQWLESRQFNITEQARMMGIPAPLLLAAVEGSAMTYQNMEHVDLQLMRHTVMDYLNVIEDALTELLASGTEARFQPFGALRSDNKTRAEINQIYVAMGAKSLEDVAREESFSLPTTAPAAAPSSDENQGADA